jgi:hypothetical protein
MPATVKVVIWLLAAETSPAASRALTVKSYGVPALNPMSVAEGVVVDPMS